MAFSLYDTDVGFDLKQWYHDQEVEYCVFTKKPFLDSLARNPNAGGESDPVPIMLSGSHGMNATNYTSALANAGAPVGVKFIVTYGTYNTPVIFDEKARRGANKSTHAYADIVKMTIDSALNHTGIDLSVQAWGNGGAPLGQVSSTTSVDTTNNIITLNNKDDIVNFFEGMYLVGSSGDGSSASHTMRDTGRAVKVSAVNHAAGQITYTGTDISGLATSDYLFRQYAFAGDQSQGVLMKGLAAWNPYTAPGSTDSFFSVNRYQKDFLYGYSSTGDTVVESGNNIDRIRKGVAMMNSRFAAMPTDVWVHVRQWEQMSITLQQQGIRPITIQNSTGTFGYDALSMSTAAGKVNIRADRHAPVSYARVVNSEYIELRSIGPIMSPTDADGLKIRSFDTSNGPGWKIDWVSYGQIVCTRPQENGVIALQALT